MDNPNSKVQSLVLLGCGKMGAALLRGWLNAGMAGANIFVRDPAPDPWLQSQGVAINTDLPPNPSVVVLAVKPQIMDQALPEMARFSGSETLFLSVAAGKTLAQYEALLGPQTPIVRAMPNTPAAIGQGITALIGNAHVTPDQMAQAETLMRAAGTTVRLEFEAQMDAVTGVSGSGPAYVFHLIETLAAGGVAAGLPQDLAMTLAKATVAGAGALAASSEESPTTLRENVTSPNGTTQAALDVLMDETHGFPALLRKAVNAAKDRSKALGRG